MTAAKQDMIFKEIESLPINLKIELIDKLISTILPPKSDIDSLWIKEANRRKDEIEDGEIELINGSDVFEKIWKNRRI
jgi:hypothetical protein